MMKKYISPEAIQVNFCAEANVMLSISNEVSSQPQLSNGRLIDFDTDCESDWDTDE